MKILAAILFALLLGLQYPLWIGKGSWMRVRDLDQQLAQVRDMNAKARARNEALEAEVRDLKQGTDAVEERARMELGMIKGNEVFVQVVRVKR